MENTWHNNRISEKLNKEYPFDFSIMDIDGLVRSHYKKDNKVHTRLIFFESKNEHEKSMGSSQKKGLDLLYKAIDWSKFDNRSGVYLLKIVDLDKKIEWYEINNLFEPKFTTTFKGLYDIFSSKDVK